MDNETENGLTLGEICRIVFKRIWYVLGASALVTIVAVLLIALVMNPRKVTYRGDFQVIYPLSEAQKYPNGAPFLYHDILSNASLKEIVAADEDLKGLDVDKLLREEAVTFVAEMDEETKLYTGKYSLYLKGRYFSDYAKASRFASAISQTFVERINDSAQSVSYLVDVAVFDAMPFEKQLQSLADQKSKLLGEVDKWSALYHETYRVNGKTLKNIRAEIETVYGDVTKKTIETELERCGYVAVSDIAKRKSEIQEEISYNDLQMKALEEAIKTMGGGIDAPTTPQAALMLAAQDDTSGSTGDDPNKWVINIQSVSDLLQNYSKFVTRNEQLKYQLTQLTEANITEFSASVKKQFNLISEKAEMLAEVSAQIYRDNSRVFANQEELRRDGETNVVFVAIAAFVLVFFLAALAVFMLDAPKYKAKKLQEAQQQAPVELTEVPVQEEQNKEE